jgi:hypothetical protein
MIDRLGVRVFPVLQVVVLSQHAMDRGCGIQNRSIVPLVGVSAAQEI